MGTPEWAIPSLQAVLDSGSEINAVFTQPDRLVGRKRALTPSSIKQFSQNQKLPVHTPEKAGSPETLELVRSLAPELIIVCAYGQILPHSFLDIPRIGCFNLHFSLLPNLRGASPVQAAIASGLETTGVSLQKIVLKLDAGPLVALPTTKAFVRMTQLRYSEAGWQKLEGSLFAILYQNCLKIISPLQSKMRGRQLTVESSKKMKVEYAGLKKRPAKLNVNYGHLHHGQEFLLFIAYPEKMKTNAGFS